MSNDWSISWRLQGIAHSTLLTFPTVSNWNVNTNPRLVIAKFRPLALILPEPENKLWICSGCKSKASIVRERLIKTHLSCLTSQDFLLFYPISLSLPFLTDSFRYELIMMPRFMFIPFCCRAGGKSTSTHCLPLLTLYSFLLPPISLYIQSHTQCMCVCALFSNN